MLVVLVSFAETRAAVNVDARPATVTSYRLAELGLPAGSRVVSISDPAVSAKVFKGVLNILVPKDAGRNREISIVLADGHGNRRKVRVRVLSSFPLIKSKDSDNPLPALVVRGLAPGNGFGNAEISFGTKDDNPLSKSASRITLKLPGGGQLDATPYLKYRSSDNRLYLPASAVAILRSQIATGTFSVLVDLASRNAAFAGNYSFKASKPQAVIMGVLADSDGRPVRNLGGRRIGLAGSRTGIRRTAKLRDNGTFTFRAVASDTYRLELLDLRYPGLSTGTVAVFGADTKVNAVLYYVKPASKQSLGATPRKARYALASQFTGNGKSGPERSAGQPLQAAPQTRSIPGGCAVSSSTQGQTVQCEVAYTLAQGTKYLRVRGRITTAEFPLYTGQQSKFDDVWELAVRGIPGLAVNQYGTVNVTHKTSGELKINKCVRVAALTASNAIQVSGVAKAANIGDSQFPTTVELSLEAGCSDLSVTSAEFVNPNLQQYRVVGEHANHGGFISMRPLATAGGWGIPLTVKYEPAEATLTNARLWIIKQGSPNILAELPIPAGSGNGQVKFRDLTIPPEYSSWDGVPFSFNIQLFGTLNGVSTASEGAYPNVTRAGRNSFLPLYLAGEHSMLTGITHRYGSRDTAGDSWSRLRLINWLLATAFNGVPLRFDDVTAMHTAKQLVGSTWRSVLGHATHDNGLIADIRYADGAGGFTDTYGGQRVNGVHGYFIRQMVYAAQAEQTSGATSGSNIVRLRQWIAENRQFLDQLSADPAVSRILIGPSWMWRALVNRRFPNNTLISGVANWQLPAKVAMSTADHHSHIHLELTDTD